MLFSFVGERLFSGKNQFNLLLIESDTMQYLLDFRGITIPGIVEVIEANVSKIDVNLEDHVKPIIFKVNPDTGKYFNNVTTWREAIDEFKSRVDTPIHDATIVYMITEYFKPVSERLLGLEDINPNVELFSDNVAGLIRSSMLFMYSTANKESDEKIDKLNKLAGNLLSRINKHIE